MKQVNSCNFFYVSYKVLVVKRHYPLELCTNEYRMAMWLDHVIQAHFFLFDIVLATLIFNIYQQNKK